MSETSKHSFRQTGEGSTAGGVATAETITPKQLAAHFKTTVPTVLDWYHKGWIPAVVAVGRIYRFDLDEVKAALAAKSKPADR